MFKAGTAVKNKVDGKVGTIVEIRYEVNYGVGPNRVIAEDQLEEHEILPMAEAYAEAGMIIRRMIDKFMLPIYDSERVVIQSNVREALRVNRIMVENEEINRLINMAIKLKEAENV